MTTSYTDKRMQPVDKASRQRREVASQGVDFTRRGKFNATPTKQERCCHPAVTDIGFFAA